MKKVLLLLTCAIWGGACSDNSKEEVVVGMLPETRAISLTDEEKSFVNKNNEFSANLFKEIASADNNSSKIVSPLSVSFILAMLNNGADGQTSKEILSLIGFGDASTSLVNDYCKKMIEESPNVDANVSLALSNFVAVNSSLGLELESRFKQDLHNYYHAEVSSLDFSSSEDKENINVWCKKQTDGAISDMATLVNPASVMVLLNAVSFRATWTHKFDPQNTQKEQFVLRNGESVILPTMHQKVLAQYSANDTYSIVQLPYGSGDKWSMFVILPNKGNTVEDVIKTLCSQDLSVESSYWNLGKAVVDVKIPRYTTECDFDLKGAISKMGAPTMFTDMADFSKMTTSSRNPYVSLLEQKIKANVDEEGAKAASVTIAGLSQSLAASSDYPSVDFHANRPFVYLIREASSGAIFFIGTYQGE